MMWKNAIILMVAFAAFALPASGLQSQLAIGPAVLRSGGEWTFGLRIRAEHENRKLNLEPDQPWERLVRLSLEAPLALESRRNPETLSAAVSYGWEKSLMKVVGGLEVRDDDPIDWGFLGFTGSVEVEAPQTFDVITGAVGVVGEYVHREPRIFYIPNLRLALLAMGCAKCANDDGSALFGRGDAEARIVVPFSFDALPGALHPVQLRLDARAFHTFGQPRETEPMLETGGVSGGVELAYRRVSSRGWWEVFVRWRDGRLPVVDVDARAWTLGVAYAF